MIHRSFLINQLIINYIIELLSIFRYAETKVLVTKALCQLWAERSLSKIPYWSLYTISKLRIEKGALLLRKLEAEMVSMRIKS